MKFLIALLIAYFSISLAHAKGVSDVEYSKAKNFVNAFDDRIKGLSWDSEVNNKGWRSCADMDRFMTGSKDARIKKSFAKQLKETKECKPFISFKDGLIAKHNNSLSIIALYEKEKLISINKEINIMSGKLKAQGIKLELNSNASTVGDAEKTLNVMTNKFETIRRNDLEKRNQQVQKRKHLLELKKLIPLKNDELTDAQKLGGSIYSSFKYRADTDRRYFGKTLQHWKKATNSKKDLLLDITLQCSSQVLNKFSKNRHKELSDVYFHFGMKHLLPRPTRKEFNQYYPKLKKHSIALHDKRKSFDTIYEQVDECLGYKIGDVVAENEEMEKLKLLSKKQLGELAIAKKDYENFKIKHKTVIAKNGLLNPNASLSESKIMVTLIRKGLTVEFIKEGVSKRVVDFCWNKFAPMTDKVSECVVFNMLRG